MSPAAMLQRAWRGSDGREYVTNLDGGTLTPAPWINVISDSAFGFQVLDLPADDIGRPCHLVRASELGHRCTRSPAHRHGRLNDGMNCIGEKGRGESIWLGWLLHAALTAFAPDAPEARAASWRQHCDGTPRGLALNDECHIASVAVMERDLGRGRSRGGGARHGGSGDAACPARSVTCAVVRTAFDKTAPDPGYIKD